MMNFHTDIEQQSILIEGIRYSGREIREKGSDISTGGTDFKRELFTFLSEWFDAGDTMLVHTSGSTGQPKELRVKKEHMMASACLTCSFLELQEGDTALLCMPLKYIAGKMVVVRALVAGLDLLPVTPSGHPLGATGAVPVFAAMIPMQVYNSLQVPGEKKKLCRIKHLIIGGGAIDVRFAGELKELPNAVWSTYGMTETLSHIALRRLNGPMASDWYTPLKEVDIRLSGEGTLVIHAPRVCSDELTTNDIAEIDVCNRFRILGRRDNTINSGGVKIQAEQVENALLQHILPPFLVTSVPDEKFGEMVVLLVEGQIPTDIEIVYERVLPAYWRPKRTISVPRIPLTGTGKPDRATAKIVARNSCLPISCCSNDGQK